MKAVLEKLLPKARKDIFSYYLIAIAFMPLIYLMLGRRHDYMSLNALFLILFAIILIFYVTYAIRTKNVRNLFQSPAFCLLFFMFLWIFVSAFFAYDKSAAWIGMFQGIHQEESVWQYVFYFSIAFSIVMMKKENLKYLLSVFLVVSTIVILLQFRILSFGYLFVHKNHTGYYLCMTVMIAAGMFLYSKDLVSKVLTFWVLLLHFVSLILNGSIGPIIGLIAFFVLAFIYFLIHKRIFLLKFVSIFLCFVSVVAIFDYVPKVRDLRDEEATTVEKIVGISMVALNKLGIISQEELENAAVAPGSNGYSRLMMWQRAYENMLEFPIFGLGSGCWLSYNDDMPNPKPHNEFLQYGITGGFPTMIAYLSLLGYLFINFRRKHKEMSSLAYISLGAILVYVVQSIFGNIMPFTAPLYYVLIGIAIKEVDCEKFCIKPKDDEDEKNKKETLKLEEN